MDIKRDPSLPYFLFRATSAERIIYRHALFYHLLRLFHGMWLLKLGNPEESINLKQMQKMRNLLAHHSEKAGEEELFIFASAIRNKLFPDTQIVGTREKQELLKEKFRAR